MAVIFSVLPVSPAAQKKADFDEFQQIDCRPLRPFTSEQLCGHSLRPHVATAVSVQPLDFRPSPRCFSEELQAGSNAGVMSETANGDLAPHFLPADVFDQLLQHHGQSDSVQRIQGTLSSHTIQAKPGSYLFCEVCSDGASPAIIVTFTAD